MRENELDVLGQYDINVNSVKKIRGATLCDTKQGVFLLKEMQFSEKRLSSLCRVYSQIRDHGYHNVDEIIKNREEEFFSASENGTKYILKKWFYGRECDSKREQDVLAGVQNIALLHRVMCLCKDNENTGIVVLRLQESVKEEFERHNREMKKMRTFMRNKVNKSEFETVYLKNFDAMYEWAMWAEAQLSSFAYEQLWKDNISAGRIAHGDYNYHNILVVADGIATTNFEHVCVGIQLEDFYYFLRKTMEKNRWDVKLGHKMLECYNRIHPLAKEELLYLSVRIAYPEKIWKAVNTYNRSRKSWISAKSIEKLNMAIAQTQERKEFLKTIFSFPL